MWIPVGHSPDVDLIAQVEEALLRVQVKTSTSRGQTSEGEERWYVALSTSGGNQSWTGTVKWFDFATVDFLFVLVGDGRRWFIPANTVEGRRGLALGGPKYSEFEVEPGEPIMHLVYGDSASLKSSPGEYPSGQRTRTVNPPAYAFAGSNPASPIPPTADQIQPTKYERKLGRSCQAVIWTKRRVTIPQEPFHSAGFEIGGRIHARADGPGRVILERMERPWLEQPELPADTEGADGAELE